MAKWVVIISTAEKLNHKEHEGQKEISKNNHRGGTIPI
jgi:hypothetical protein